MSRGRNTIFGVEDRIRTYVCLILRCIRIEFVYIIILPLKSIKDRSVPLETETMAPQVKILAIFAVHLLIFAVQARGSGGQNKIFLEDGIRTKIRRRWRTKLTPDTLLIVLGEVTLGEGGK